MGKPKAGARAFDAAEERALLRVVEQRVPHEIRQHFSDMMVYQRLRSGQYSSDEVYGEEQSGRNGGKLSSSSQQAVARTGSGVKRQRGSECDPTLLEVHVERCSSRVISSLPCSVMRDYYAMWVESTLGVKTVAPSPAPSKLRQVLSYPQTASSPSSRKSSATALKKSPRGTRRSAVNGCDEQLRRHRVKFFTLHLVNRNAHVDPARHSFVLQSVCLPGPAPQLECYPRRMIHFGLLMYALWHCPSEVITSICKRCEPSRAAKSNGASSGSVVKAGRKGARTLAENGSSGTSAAVPSYLPPLLVEASPATHSKAGEGVLVLGLGGNVIGSWLDNVLPPSVKIDVVEMEPAVLEICRQQQRVPPCEELVDSSGRGTGVWVVSKPHARHPHYRFVVGDAREVLQIENCTKRGKSGLGSRLYTVIFLDCYDPVKDCMLHEASLIDLCRDRLAPGGLVIVNAHILPRTDTLEEQFLSRGFVTVQVLRIASCQQCMVVCISGHGQSVRRRKTAHLKWLEKREAGEEVEMAGRFCLQPVARLAQHMRASAEALSATNWQGDLSFLGDTHWLKSSNRLESDYCDARLWEHYD
ncbi:hypothetical protein ERJ75_001172300 [Trypanosoma vivax]|nr:hypothetical protein ERJ75_001172300 [Trypanosoma vivax]